MIHALAHVGEHLAAAWYWLRARLAGARMDITQINPQLWTGGTIETAADVAQLIADGVTGDIDCQEEHDDASVLARDPRIAYHWAPQTDDGQPKPVAWFADSWTFAKPILENGGVLVCHCAAGHNRGPSMAAFVLMAHWGLSEPDAVALIKAKRPVATLAYAPDAARAITALGLR